MADKPYRSIDQLVSLMVDDRGLVCDDRRALARFLRVRGYYHVSGYAREFQIDPTYGNDRFLPGTTLADIEHMMDLDSRLRPLILAGLSRVEVAVRALFSHEYAKEYGSRAFYLEDGFYQSGGTVIGREVPDIPRLLVSDLRRHGGRIVARYEDPSVSGDTLDALRARYREVPIWAAMETIPFGHLSLMIRNAVDYAPSKRLTELIGVQWASFSGVIHSFVVLRNLCAHNLQLWNRYLDIQCPVQRKFRPRGLRFASNGIYPALVMLRHYNRCIDGDVSASDEIDALLEEDARFSEGILNPKPK